LYILQLVIKSGIRIDTCRLLNISDDSWFARMIQFLPNENNFFFSYLATNYFSDDDKQSVIRHSLPLQHHKHIVELKAKKLQLTISLNIFNKFSINQKPKLHEKV